MNGHDCSWCGNPIDQPEDDICIVCQAGIELRGWPVGKPWRPVRDVEVALDGVL